MKVGSVFRRRMAEYGSGEEDANIMGGRGGGRDRHGIMVWEAIGINHKAGPVNFQIIGPGRCNGVTALRYINQVLRLHIVPYFIRHHHNTFQQDNARAHTARDSNDFLQQHNMRIMPWPAQSPDLNPTEHLWDEIQRKLNEVRPRPMTFIFHSMYRRCMCVVNAHVDTRNIDSPQLMSAMIYLLLETLRKHSPVSGEDVCNK